MQEIVRYPLGGYHQDSYALFDSPLGPPFGAAARPATLCPGSSGRPFALCDVFETSHHEREGGVPVWEDARVFRPASNPPAQALDDVVSVYMTAVFAGDSVGHETRVFTLGVDLRRRPDGRCRHRPRYALRQVHLVPRRFVSRETRPHAMVLAVHNRFANHKLILLSF